MGRVQCHLIEAVDVEQQVEFGAQREQIAERHELLWLLVPVDGQADDIQLPSVEHTRGLQRFAQKFRCHIRELPRERTSEYPNDESIAPASMQRRRRIGEPPA